MATRVTDAALVSRVSRARALLSLNLKKKRDCSQSTSAVWAYPRLTTKQGTDYKSHTFYFKWVKAYTVGWIDLFTSSANS